MLGDVVTFFGIVSLYLWRWAQIRILKNAIMLLWALSILSCWIHFLNRLFLGVHKKAKHRKRPPSLFIWQVRAAEDCGGKSLMTGLIRDDHPHRYLNSLTRQVRELAREAPSKKTVLLNGTRHSMSLSQGAHCPERRPPMSRALSDLFHSFHLLYLQFTVTVSNFTTSHSVFKILAKAISSKWKDNHEPNFTKETFFCYSWPTNECGGRVLIERF